MRKTRRISYRAARAVPQAPVLLLIVFVWTQATLGSAAEIRLKGGRVVSGTIESVAKDKVEIKTPGTTRLALPIASLEPPDRQWLDRMRQIHQDDPAQIRKCADLYVLFHPDEASAIASTLPPKEAAASPAPTPAPSPTPRVAPPPPQPTATPQPPPAPSLPRPTPKPTATPQPPPASSLPRPTPAGAAAPTLVRTPAPVSPGSTAAPPPISPPPAPARQATTATSPSLATRFRDYRFSEIEKSLQEVVPKIVTLDARAISDACDAAEGIRKLEKQASALMDRVPDPDYQGRISEIMNRQRKNRDLFLAEWEKGEALFREYIDILETVDFAIRYGAPQAELDRLGKELDTANPHFQVLFQSLRPAADNLNRDYKDVRMHLPLPSRLRKPPSGQTSADQARPTPRSPRLSPPSRQRAIRSPGQ